MKLRPLLCAGLVALLSGSLGCSRKPAPEAPEQKAAPAPAPSQGRVKFLAMDYDTKTSNLLKSQVEAYNKSGAGTPVDIEVVPWDRGHQKLATLLSGGQAPDLAIIATIWLPEYVESGVLEPLDSWVKTEFRDQFISKPPLLDAGSVYQQRLYGLPIAVSARALYYNKGILDKAGVKPPATWDELVKVAQKVTRAPEVYGFGVQGNKIETDTYWYYFLWGNGGDILDAAGQPAFSSQAGIEALQFEADLVQRYKVSEPNPTGYNREEMQNLFKQGRLAMMVTGPWFSNMLPKEAPSIKFGVAPVPRKKASGTMAVTDNLVLFNTGTQKEATWKFVQWLYRKENRLAFDRTSGMLPELKAVAADPYYQKDPYRKAFMDLLPEGRFAPLHRQWMRISEANIQAVQAVLLGQKQPREALEGAAEKVRQLTASGKGGEPARP